MNKNNALLFIAVTSLCTVVGSVFISNSGLPETGVFALNRNGGGEVWHHYAEVSATESTYGSREFWAKGSEGCTRRYFDDPGVDCEEHDFSSYEEFATLTYGHELYIPSLFDQRNAVYPIDNRDDTFNYGVYPQSKVNDSSLRTAINGLDDSAIGGNSWYLYQGAYYAKLDSDNWFKCEPIRWIVMTNYGGGKYLLCSYVSLDVHRFDDDSSNYQYSELREFVNEDVFPKAFFLNDDYVEGSDDYFNDKMYVYTRPDYKAYFEDGDGYPLRPSGATDWLRANGAYVSSNQVCYWTSSAVNGTEVAFGAIGGGYGNQKNITDETCCIRPGITIDISK